MNKRIEELAAQCRTVTDYGMGKFETFDAQKFAGLMMQECATACNDEHCCTLYSPKELIDMRFGIDE